jgi:anti-sigma regulatory factor (Ser/Thr protein kinase)
MPARPTTALHDATAWITPLALAHPLDLPAALAARTGRSRAAAQRLLGRLVDAQWLERDGSRRRPLYRPGALRQVVRRYALAGLEEDRPWAQDFAAALALPAAVARMLRHALSELLNNAIEHSGGRTVTVSMRRTPLQAQLLVADDGRGAFDAIRAACAIDDPAQAMFEIAKGRLTTRPADHGGRGLYHTAALADVFDLHANGHGWRRIAGGADGEDAAAARWQPVRTPGGAGTAVYVAVAIDTARTLDQALRAGSREGCRGWIDHARLPLRLLADDGVLESRALARRAAWRLERCAAATLDYAGIRDVGPAFADEIGRVLPQRLPGLQWQHVNASAAVAAQLAIG